MKRTRISEDFIISARIFELADKEGWPDPRTERDAFVDYHLAKGSLMADWEAAFRTWLRNAKKWGNNGKGHSAEPKGFAAIRQILKTNP